MLFLILFVNRAVTVSFLWHGKWMVGRVTIRGYQTNYHWPLQLWNTCEFWSRNFLMNFVVIFKIFLFQHFIIVNSVDCVIISKVIAHVASWRILFTNFFHSLFVFRKRRAVFLQDTLKTNAPCWSCSIIMCFLLPANLLVEYFYRSPHLFC